MWRGLLLALVAGAVAAPRVAGSIRDIGEVSTAKKGVERASECLAFIEAIRVYHLVLIGLPHATGQNTTDERVQFDWVWAPETGSMIELAIAGGAFVDYSLVSEYVDSFGSVGPRTLLQNRPEYINNVRVCRDELKAING